MLCDINCTFFQLKYKLKKWKVRQKNMYGVVKDLLNVCNSVFFLLLILIGLWDNNATTTKDFKNDHAIIADR